MDSVENSIAKGYADFADDNENTVDVTDITADTFEDTNSFLEMSDINKKLRSCFDGKIVRKDLTKSIKEGANVPVYVLEFLLGQYCSSDDPMVIEEGLNRVKRILAENYVRPDEAQKVLSLLRQRGSHTVIDKITVNLNIKRIHMRQSFPILGLKEFRLMRNIRVNTTGFCVEVSGASYSWNTNLLRKIRTPLLFSFTDLPQSRCRMLISMN